MGEDKPELTGAQLQDLLRAKNQEAIRACNEEVNEILTNYGCALMPVVEIRGQQVVSYVEIVRRLDA